MRALAVLVTSFVVLAIVQGAYIVVDARQKHKSLFSSDDAHEEHHNHHHTHPKPSANDTASIHATTTPPVPSYPDTSRDTHPGLTHKAHHKLCKENPNAIACKMNQSHKHEKGHKHHHRDHHNEHGKLPSANDSVHHIFELSIHDHGTGYHADTKPIQVNHQKPEAAERKQETQGVGSAGEENEPNKTKDEKDNGQRERKEEREGKKDYVKERHRQNRQHRKEGREERRRNEKENRRKQCIDDSDCGEGRCCIRRKDGRSVCRKGGSKTLMRKCTTNCECVQGLKCFVSDFNKAGKRKHPHPGHRVLGRCNPPNGKELGPGYFMEDEDLLTPSPSTPQPGV